MKILNILGLFFLIASVQADDYRDVLSANGAPAEKIEKETKRQDVWIYNNKTVAFSNGSSGGQALSPVVEAAKPAIKAKQTVRKSAKTNLGELLSDLKLADRGDQGAPPATAPGQPRPRPLDSNLRSGIQQAVAE